MSAEYAVERVTKVKRLVDVKVECDEPFTYVWDASGEARAKRLESWAREFNDFIRDHRSQDQVQLRVIREFQEQCSACDRKWETMLDDGKTYCAWCGVEVE